MNLEESRYEISLGLGSNKGMFETRLTYLYNMAQSRLARLYEWEELDDDDDITVEKTANADDDRRIHYEKHWNYISGIVVLDGSNSHPLTFVPKKKWIDRIGNSEGLDRGDLAEYTTYKRQILLNPVPSGTENLRIYFNQVPRKLVKGGDVTIFREKDDILIELALLRAFITAQNEDKANWHYRIFKGLMEEAVRKENTKPDRQIMPDSSETNLSGKRYWLDPFDEYGYG